MSTDTVHSTVMAVANAFLREFIMQLENEGEEYPTVPTGECLDYWLHNYGK